MSKDGQTGPRDPSSSIHAHLAGRDGVNLKTRVRKHLEGWDFIDLATDEDPIPRVATIPTLGHGWVDFIRSIGAITLFGRGFCELIQPDVSVLVADAPTPFKNSLLELMPK